MKQTITLFFLFALLSGFAQKHFLLGPNLTYTPISSRSTAQTIQWATGSVPAIYASPGGGYVCGTDGYGTIENAQIFKTNQKFKVLGALIWFADKKYLSNDTNSKLIFKVNTLDGTFINQAGANMPGPGTVLGQTSVRLDDINVGFSVQTGGNQIVFPNPIAVDSAFAITIDMRSMNALDTIGLVSSTDGNGGGREEAIEHWGFLNEWHSFYDSLNWDLDIDLFIWPIVDRTQFTSITGNICANSTYDFNGTTITAAGTYRDTILTSLGYDSIVTLQLTELLGDSINLDTAVCKGDIYFFNGNFYDTAGTYKVRLQNRFGCDSLLVLQLGAKVVDTSVIVSNGNLTAHDATAKYQWYTCAGTLLTSDTLASFTPLQSGSYKVSITKNGCTSLSDCYAVTALGVDETSLLNFNLLPNPTHDVCTIYFNGQAGKLSGTIYNLTGAIVKHLTIAENATQFSFQTSDLAAGVYMLKIADNNGGLALRKLVVE